MSNLEKHAEKELRLAGLFDKDSDYGGDTGIAVMELVRVFASQGHSGMSAQLTLAAFRRVANYETLTPIGNPTTTGEYNVVADDVWQSTRDGAMFSDDRGRSWYHLDKYRTRWQRLLSALRSRGLPINIRHIRGRVPV